MTAFYNEIDPYAAQWLRNLIEAGHIAPGVVDERSIEDIKPDELMGYTQCHFFAGVGVWSLALRRAGWPDNRPVWTGSCPCQPFSAAGAGAGFADPRHLWPTFAWLIKQCAPAVVIGEQVASKAVEPWVDLVHADLEAMGYAFGAVPFPSAGVGAPHIRDRLYWVADAQVSGWGEERPNTGGIFAGNSQEGFAAGSLPGCTDGGMAYPDMPEQNGIRAPGREQQVCHGNSDACEVDPAGPVNGFWRDADWLGCTDGLWRPVEPGTFPLADGVASRMDKLRAYGNAINAQAAQEFIAAYLDSTQGE